MRGVGEFFMQERAKKCRLLLAGAVQVRTAGVILLFRLSGECEIKRALACASEYSEDTRAGSCDPSRGRIWLFDGARGQNARSPIDRSRPGINNSIRLALCECV